MKRQTKIIATIGPKTDSKAKLTSLIKTGVNIIRINFSHGTHVSNGKIISNVKAINKSLGSHAAIMLDTKGPEIRTINKKDIEIKKGKTYAISHKKSYAHIPVSYEYIAKDCKVGQTIQIDGGAIEMKVTRRTKDTILVKAKNGGTITPQRHVNVPGVRLALPILSAEDKEDLQFGIKKGIHMIAASFVADAKDIKKIRNFVQKHTKKYIPIIAKIESQSALDNVDSIIEASDGIMIARGDLGVEIPFYKVPTVQRMLIDKAHAARKPIIMATQMLKSMVDNPLPTRAELTDVSNAVIRGVDATMLSEETSIGKYPIKCIKVMSVIAEEAEQFTQNVPSLQTCHPALQEFELFKAGIEMADCLHTSAIVLKTNNLRALHELTSFKGVVPVTVLTTSDEILYNASLLRGVTAYKLTKSQYTAHNLVPFLKRKKIVQKNKKILMFFDLKEKDKILDTIQIITT